MNDRNTRLAELEAEAEEKTWESKREAENALHDEWVEFVTKNSKYGHEDSFPEKGIFVRALEYLKSRKQSIAKGFHVAGRSWAEDCVRLVLEFNFLYTYDSYSVADPDADNPFSVGMDTDTKVGYWSHKVDILDALKDYLLEGGAMAKKLGSAAYPLWQKVLMDFEFTHNGLQYGTDGGSLKSFFDEIRHAAKMTHVDREIAERLEKSVKKPSKRKK